MKHQVAIVPLIVALLAACGAATEQSARPDPDPPAVQTLEPVSLDLAPATPLGPLSLLRNRAHLRYDFAALDAMAVRARDGGMAIDLGTVGSRKHTNGGWRDGWAVKEAAKAQTPWFAMNERRARLWFSPPSKTYERVNVRLRRVGGPGEISFFVNGERVHTETVGSDWRDVSFKVPPTVVRPGENVLELRLSKAPRGSARTAHVDHVHILPADVTPDDLPRGPAVGTLEADGLQVHSLLAPTPQSHIYRLHVPEGAPRLGFSLVAAKPAAELVVTARSDTVAAGQRQILFHHTVETGSEQTWREVVVHLDRYAGHVVELCFEAGGSWPDGQAVGWGEPGLYTEPLSDEAIAAPDARPAAENILVFMIDTLRYDRFDTLYEDNVVQAPALDRFAKDALVYAAAYNPGNWTKPSVASLMTSVYPSRHGARLPIDKVPSELTLLSEHLQDAGFTTASFVANAYVTPDYGFGQGWDYHRNYIGERPINRRADTLVSDTIAWLDAHQSDGRRKFLYVHVIDPHAPYNPDHDFRDQFWDEPYRGPILPYLTDRQMNLVQRRELPLDETDKAFVNALYDAEVAFTDHHFARLIKALRERGLYDNTAILVVSDHGEEFWDHGRAGHGHSPHEELVHTPFFLRYPGRVPRGRVLPHVVSTVDVAPTLLDLAGVPGWDGMEGVSLVDTFDGHGKPRPRAALFEGQSRFMAVRAGRYRLITYKNRRKLYDLHMDPTEQRDLLGRSPVATAYTRGITGMMLGAPDKSRWWEAVQLPVALEEVTRTEAVVDPRTREQLEALGYVEGVEMEDIVEEDPNDPGDSD